MKYRLILFFYLSLLSANSDEYVLLISFDGFRYDYIDMADTPTFDKFISSGVSSESLIPIFPSLTFPNHYSIATGSYANQHRILSNSFYSKQLGEKYSMYDSNTVRNGNFYGMEPIWVTAEKNGIISATYFWIGSEAEISGFRPSIYKNYDGSIPFEARVDSVVSWLRLPKDKRPILSMLYFSEPDYTGHKYGTQGSEIINSIESMDKLFSYILSEIDKLDFSEKINIIVVSDHGMTEVSRDRVVLLDKYIDIDNFNIILGPSLTSLNYKEGISNLKIDDIDNLSIFNQFNIPEDFEFLNFDMPDFLILADKGWFITTENNISEKKSFPLGMHGYLTNDKDMHGSFFASGPSFNKGLILESFENINIYPLICEILNIAPYNGCKSDNWDYQIINRLLK